MTYGIHLYPFLKNTNYERKKKVFSQIFTLHSQIKTNRKYIKLHTLHCIHFSFFLNRRCIHILNCRNFQNFIHISVKLILNRKFITQWNF